MKYFFLIILSYCLISCCKDEPIMLGHPYWGEAHADRNGEKWVPKVQALQGFSNNSEFIGLNLEWFDPVTAFKRESLGLFDVPTNGTSDTIVLISRDGSDNMPVSTSYWTLLDDGDVLGDKYELLKTENNWIFIANWNSSSEEIEGTFQVSFVFRDGEHLSPDAPDTLRFRNGYFKTKIVN